MFNWLTNLFAAKPAAASSSRGVRVVRARYDAAVTNDDNRRHWANADGLSANSANSAEVRRILRNRSRYEVANNSYARGIVLTLAHDVVGTGPRLQLLTSNTDANNRIRAVASDGTISRIAGTGTASSNGDGAAGNLATVNGPFSTTLGLVSS